MRVDGCTQFRNDPTFNRFTYVLIGSLQRFQKCGATCQSRSRYLVSVCIDQFPHCCLLREGLQLVSQGNVCLHDP